jgi:hypothetical protein
VIDVADPDEAMGEANATIDPGTLLRFRSTPPGPEAAGRTVVLDTTWTPPPGTDPARIVSVRDLARDWLAANDLIAVTSAALDGWAKGSGIIDRLTIRGTSFWYYVRLRHWLWLEERILWAGIVAGVLAAGRPGRIVVESDADANVALLDVLRLVRDRDGIELDEPAAPEPEPAPPGTAGSGTSPRAASTSSSVAPPPSAAPGRSARSAIRRVRRVLGRIRRRVTGPSPQERRAAELRARKRQIRRHLEKIVADPVPRLLVINEHARQVVETPDGPRTMNPYLDPIIDRLRGTALDPIVVDIRATIGNDVTWASIGGGADPRTLPADALVIAADLPAPGRRQASAAAATPATPATPAPGAPAPDRPRPTGPPEPDPRILAWKDTLPGSIQASGLDLGPSLAAEVATTAARWLPGMRAAIDRIETFLRRVRPAGILLADEYHRQDWMTAAAAAGVPVGAVQHGMIYAHHNGYIHAERPASLRLPARTYVFGRWERDLLTSASVYRDDEVVVGGSPRLDLAAPGRDLTERHRVREELGVTEDERMIVVSGTWGGLYRRFHYPIGLAGLVDRPLPGVHVVVKLHPGERDEGPYRAILEGAAAARGVPPPQVSAVQRIDLYRLLNAADAHLGIHSTVLTEAVVTRTPNLLVDGVAGADLLGYVAAGVAHPVHDGASLLAALGAPDDGAPPEAAAAAFVAEHFEPGDASGRIADDLLAWLA